MANDTTVAAALADLVWGAQIGTYEFHPALDRLLWSPEQMHLYGVTATPATAAEFFQLVHPDDRARVEAESHAIALSTLAGYSHSFRIQRPDGSVRVILDRGSITRTPSGEIASIRGVNVDVTDEAHLNYSAEARLRASELRYRKLFDAIDEGFCIAKVRTNPDGRTDYRVIDANPAFYTKTGFPLDILNAWMRKAAPALEDHWFETYGKVARTGQPMRFENHSHFLGKWFDVYAFPIDDPRKCHVAILFNDITDRKNEAEQSRLLVEEINHRSKNTLGIVQAIARLTATSGTNDFLPRFGERVRALAASHDLLVRKHWQGVSLAELLRTQLAPFDDAHASRITTEGPQLSLTAIATKALGMAFHELATNSLKHGALANATGRVAVLWSVDETGPEPRFTLSWQESGGPEVAPPTRQGFGTTVITQMTENSTGGAVTTTFAAEGLVWHLSCPLRNLHP